MYITKDKCKYNYINVNIIIIYKNKIIEISTTILCDDYLLIENLLTRIGFHY